MHIADRMKAVLDAEARAILALEIGEQHELAVQALKDCTGKIVATGIGKAGIIASKFAATLCSGTTPAVFLHPAEAAHGDLGLVSSQDCIVAFSTSGKSREVLEMIELARHLGVSSVIGVTSHPDSKLRDLSDIILDMGIINEPCPLGLTPSASMAAMLALSDALALALMELKGVSKQDYGLRHHGGYLGQKARLENVSDK